MSSITNQFSNRYKLASYAIAQTASLAKEITALVGTVALACMGLDTFNFELGETRVYNISNVCGKKEVPLLLNAYLLVSPNTKANCKYFAELKFNQLIENQAALIPLVFVATAVSYKAFHKIQKAFTFEKESPVSQHTTSPQTENTRSHARTPNGELADSNED